MNTLQLSPFDYFADNAGAALQNGYIYIGLPNLDAQTNQITVYWDAAFTSPVTQPIRTTNGYPIHAGVPARVYVNQNHSVKVLDSTSTLVWTYPNLSLDQFNVKDFGAVGDGTTDDTVAIQQAINAANAAKVDLLIPAGKYRLDPANGTALSMTTYNFGDASLQAALTIPYGLRVHTAGSRTELWFVNLNATTSVGIAIGEDGTTGSGASQKTHEMDGFMVRSVSAYVGGVQQANVGRYGILMPKNVGLRTNKRPKYHFLTNLHFAGTIDNSTLLNNPPQGWAVGMLCGDCVKLDGVITGYGTYDATSADTGQHHMTMLKVSAADGAYGINVKLVVDNCYTGVDFSDGVEGFALTDSEFQGCYRGVITSNADGEPGGFIDNVHTNTVREGFRLVNRTLIHIGKIEAYKSDGYYTDTTTPWYGVRVISGLNGAGVLVHTRVDIGYLICQPGLSFISETNNAAVAADAGSVVTLDGYSATGVYRIAALAGSQGCRIGDGWVNEVTNIIVLSASAADIQGGNVRYLGRVPSNYFTTDGSVDLGQVDFPDDTLITPERCKLLNSDDASTSFTIKPRLTTRELHITMVPGSGAHTYSVYLDRVSAVDGDEAIIYLVGNASTNPTIKVYSAVGGTLLSTYNSIGATRRLCRYVYSAAAVAWSGGAATIV